MERPSKSGDISKSDSDAGDGKKMDFRSRVSKVKHKVIGVIKGNFLLLTTIFGVLLGFAVGFITRQYSPTEDALQWIGLPGQLYLRLFKMLIVPLIMCTVICGASSLDPKSNGKISLIAFVFIVSVNAAGSALGIGFAVLFQPGVNVTKRNEEILEQKMHTTDIFIDLILNIIPDNLFEATFSQTQTMYRSIEVTVHGNNTGKGSNATEKYYGKANSPNIMGLIFAGMLFGIAALKLGEKGKPFLSVIQSTSDIVTMVLKWFVWTTPVGVISLIAESIASITDVTMVFKQMGMFVATVTTSVAVYQLILMPAVLFVTTKRNPFYFLVSIAGPWMIAFATTTTAIAIPQMLHSCEVKNKIDRRVSGFVVPFSVSISCAGGAIYISAATLFISNLSGSEISIKDYLILWVLSSMAAMAIPSVPSASLVTALMVMTSMNIQIDDIALLLALEWFIDRIRVTCSIVSHTFCAATVHQFCKNDLKPVNKRPECEGTETGSTDLNQRVQERPCHDELGREN